LIAWEFKNWPVQKFEWIENKLFIFGILQ